MTNETEKQPAATTAQERTKAAEAQAGQGMKLDNKRLQDALDIGGKLRWPSFPFLPHRGVSGLFRPAMVQAAALCLRPGPKDTPRLLLVRTLNTRRWILPKGWPIEGLTLAEAAAQEAWEEGGVRGTIATNPIGSFSYRKIRKGGVTLDCRADVFVLIVDTVSEDFPEKDVRERRWVTPTKAADLVNEPELRDLLRQL